jgi:hypothetical protein
VVAALEVDIGQIPGIDGKRGALKRPSLLVDRAGGIFLRAAQKWTPKDKTATPAAPHALSFTPLLLVLDIGLIDGA